MSLLIASTAALGAGSAAGAVETRQFEGEGSSSMGLAYHYAYQQALGRAQQAGFGDCEVIDSFTWPGGHNVWVLLECSR